MSLTRTDENEILTALYNGLHERKPYAAFLDRLRARTIADLCRVSVRSPHDSGWLHNEESGARKGMDYPPPSFALFDQMRPGRVYMAGELGEDASVPARHMRINGSEGGALVVSILRSGDDFAAREAALLSALAPHLAIMLRSRIEIERQHQQIALSDHLLKAFHSGWLLLDAEGRLIDQDTGGGALLNQGKVMTRASDGRVRLRRPEAEAMLDRLAALGGERPFQAGWLSYDPPIEFVVAPLSRWLGERETAHYFLYFRALPQDHRRKDEARLFADLLTLTPSEAMFTAHLATGIGIAEAAEELGLTIETARNYSKKIYGKTAMSGQVELLHLLLSGVPVPR